MTTAPYFRLGFALLLLVAAGAGSLGMAQDQAQDEQPMPEMEQPNQQPMPRGGPTEMQDMARAMESMAEMCRLMMQREMQYKPYLMIAGAVVAALLAVALVLLIVLEVQGIRFLGVRVKTERQKLA